jgi:IS5 family transposase
VLAFKVLILQSLYNLSDDQAEFQIRDRLSFMWFLGLSLGETVLEAKTIWLFREQLTEAGLTETVFQRSDTFLDENAFSARKGQIGTSSSGENSVMTARRQLRREAKGSLQQILRT